ncbi:mannitol dehydrogenase family protein [Streptomyces sp. SID13726]|uniref:mannitol dehydrogenase family protein n=1 Tax=Streptomyces sp. SID13726 TaxID=2706058 RepID=UPI0031BA8738
MSESLSRTTVSRLPAELRPLADPAELRTRVVHFGLGAFHRAHQAVYTERAAALSGEPWGITAVAPSSTETVRALREQDCLYSLTSRRPGGLRCRVVGSVVDALAMGPDAGAVDVLLTDPSVTVVSLTVTEKGYRRSPFSPVIERLATGLAARMRAGAPPVTVVSCDNMAANGAVLQGVLYDFVRSSPWPDRSAVLDRMAESVAFPSTVVDRIVPATSEADRAGALDALGLEDALPVTGEPYRQWVLEDCFAAPRPPWERDGALFVPDVTPYQLTKLRLLNGSHSALAYLGLAAGLDTIAETMESDWGERLVRALCAEVSPTLPAGGPDPLAYADDLVVRFRNPAMRHLLRQIGTDGALKIRERWLPALRQLRARGGSTPVLELALAAWTLTVDQPVPAVLRAMDLADDDTLAAAITARLPALRAGRIEI